MRDKSGYFVRLVRSPYEFRLNTSRSVRGNLSRVNPSGCASRRKSGAKVFLSLQNYFIFQPRKYILAWVGGVVAAAICIPTKKGRNPLRPFISKQNSVEFIPRSLFPPPL
jgi:hypothetical protein